jgi:hypothetical protein
MLDRYESERRKRKSNAAASTTPTTNASNKKQKTDQNENHQDTSSRDKHKHKDNDRIIIGWLPNGTAFKIYDEERFVREIMPSYFSSSNQSQEEQCTFEDFKRSLTLWYVGLELRSSTK